MTLDERIEAAARAYCRWSCPDECDCDKWDGVTEPFRLALAAAFPELFTSPPTMWLAPMTTTEEMRLAMWNARGMSDAYRSARDAHLNREGK